MTSRNRDHQISVTKALVTVDDVLLPYFLDIVVIVADFPRPSIVSVAGDEYLKKKMVRDVSNGYETSNVSRQLQSCSPYKNVFYKIRHFIIQYCNIYLDAAVCYRVLQTLTPREILSH